MLGDGGSPKEALRPDFNRSIMIDFRGAKISSDTGFLLLREMDERFGVIGPMEYCLEDRRSSVHTRHSLIQMIRQRVYQIAAGYEDCNDADHLRIDPALRLAIGKGHNAGAGQSMMSRLENDVLGNGVGHKALDGALRRSTDALLLKKDKRRLIVDVDSTFAPIHMASFARSLIRATNPAAGCSGRRGRKPERTTGCHRLLAPGGICPPDDPGGRICVISQANS